MATIDFGQPRAVFFSVLSDGKFHHSVPEGTEGAVLREYETSDGKKDSKWEVVAEAISGKIENINFRDGDYGKQLHVAFAGDETDSRTVVISLNVASNFAEDFMAKLPNIDVEKDVKLKPYSFEDDNGKKKRGITVYQNDQKIQSAYHKLEKKNGKEKYVPANGYPKVPAEAKKWDSDDWKIYFAQARKFLIAEVEKHPLYNLEYRAPVKDGEDTETKTQDVFL